MKTENREPVELLAERFIELRRLGQRVTVEDYAVAHPENADEIRELFPTILALESAKASGLDERPRRFEAPQRLGDLRILSEIGRGGMGVVYEAEQESLGRRVAVKVLPGRMLFDTRQLERFRREARTAAALQHPNIVPVYGIGEQDGLHYLVMQRVDGVGLDVLTRRIGRRPPSTAVLEAGSSVSVAGDETLPQSLAEGLAAAMATNDFNLPTATANDHARASLYDAVTVDFNHGESLCSPGEVGQLGLMLADDEKVDVDSLDPAYYQSVAKLGAQAADALAYAHSRGVLHRDIKPGNLLLDRTGRVWVTDFGLAKAVDQTDFSRTGELVGTLRYMPPEQLRGEATALSDLYSLGLTLYELVTFRSPFAAPSPSEVLQKINEHQPERPRKLNPRLPIDLERVILKAMAGDPADRYASGEELAADLRRFLDNQPVKATPLGVATRLHRWLSRNRAAAASVLFAMALGGGVTLLLDGRQSDQVGDEQEPSPASTQAEVSSAVVQAPPAFPFGQGFGRGGQPGVVPGMAPGMGLGPNPGVGTGFGQDFRRGAGRGQSYGQRGEGGGFGQSRGGQDRQGSRRGFDDGGRGSTLDRSGGRDRMGGARDGYVPWNGFGPPGGGQPDSNDRPYFGPGSDQGQDRRDFAQDQRRNRQRAIDSAAEESQEKVDTESGKAPPPSPQP